MQSYKVYSVSTLRETASSSNERYIGASDADAHPFPQTGRKRPRTNRYRAKHGGAPVLKEEREQDNRMKNMLTKCFFFPSLQPFNSDQHFCNLGHACAMVHVAHSSAMGNATKGFAAAHPFLKEKNTPPTIGLPFEATLG